MWNVVVVAFVVTAALGDVRWRKIPRAYTTAGLAVGLGFHLLHGGWVDLLYTLAAVVLAFAIGLVFFQLGAIGGGDVKLIVALAGMLGLNSWLFAMEVAVLAAGAIALVQAVRRGVLGQTLRNIGRTFLWIASSGVKAHPVINVNNATMLRAPFGVAAAVGTLVAVIRI